MRKCVVLFLFTLLHYSSASAQSNFVIPERLKVFIDCHSGCDMNYIRTEINIVDFLLDRLAADVHILITDENTGSGGDKYQLIFFGQSRFAHMRDTIYFDNDVNNTDFEERELLLKYLKLGLAPYITKTRTAKDISIQMKSDKPAGEIKTDSAGSKQKDPWNYLVFRTNLNGNISTEESVKQSSLNGGFSANRVTEEMKTGIELNGGKDKSQYEYKDDSGYFHKDIFRNDSYNFSHYLVKSINDHWSWGYQAELSRNTYSNNRMRSQFNLGIEYNIYPYKQVNTKYFTVSYRLDLRRNNYFDSTLYDKTKETLVGHGIESQLTYTQKWGQVEFGVEFHNYLHNWNYFNLKANCELDIRITGGLSFFIVTSAQLIRDQLYLPKEAASPEEVLTRRRQLATK